MRPSNPLAGAAKTLRRSRALGWRAITTKLGGLPLTPAQQHELRMGMAEAMNLAKTLTQLRSRRRRRLTLDAERRV